jgi:PelA/Pel-15E family pectate lyase
MLPVYWTARIPPSARVGPDSRRSFGMDRRTFITGAGSALVLGVGCEPRHRAASPEPALGNAPSTVSPAGVSPAGVSPATVSDRSRALAAMHRAARFMIEKAAYEGGYVWSYLPDFSRSWGELEARRSMLWVQPPGTPSVGQLLLDAWHATRDELYLGGATAAATALIAAQRPSGGWNYVHDFAGERSLEEWYASIGQSAWRMEEFHQHPDSGTFDDACTASATRFLMRVQLDRPAPRVSAALEKALAFLRQSQYPNGGWPQRYPLRQDYTRLVTFNDGIFSQNLQTLVMAHAALGAPDMLGSLRAAMDCVLLMQQPRPQPGWGLQHGLDGKPAAARSFEPAALVTHTTAANIDLLMTFHRLTGDAKFTRRVPEALDWLDAIRLAPERAREYGGTHPTFIELGRDRPIYVHRRGSNVVNGSYYVDHTFAPRLAHYSPVRSLDVEGLRQRLAELRSRPSARPLLPEQPGSVPLPEYFSPREPSLELLCTGEPVPQPPVDREEVMRIVADLDDEGRWLEPLELISNPYRGPGSKEPWPDATYASTNVGDRSDTSPYAPRAAPAGYPPEQPLIGISVRTFIRNMSTLIAFVSSTTPRAARR